MRSDKPISVEREDNGLVLLQLREKQWPDLGKRQRILKLVLVNVLKKMFLTVIRLFIRLSYFDSRSRLDQKPNYIKRFITLSIELYQNLLKLINSLLTKKKQNKDIRYQMDKKYIFIWSFPCFVHFSIIYKLYNSVDNLL